MRYRFNNIELDLDTFEMHRDGLVVPIRKMTFDVLCYLIAHRNRVVSKQEILDKLWTDTNVNESAIPWYISNLRALVGQKRSDRYPVVTVHGRGYQFKSDVQVIDERSVPPRVDSPRTTDGTNDPFVGRQEVMTYLDQVHKNTIAGKGSIIILRGEAGIGKTRCAAEFTKEAIYQGHSVWLGRCQETASQPPFWPWVQILRKAVDGQPEEEVIHGESSKLLSILVPHHNEETKTSQADLRGMTTDKFWLYDHLLRFLRSSCTTMARVIIIDDIQWIDEASLEFLSFIAPDVAALKLLLVITLRDYEDMGKRTVFMNRLLRYTEQIPLRGLSQDHVDQYVSKSGLFEKDEELSRAIHQKTGGNPFFLHEIFRWLKWVYSNTSKEFTISEIHNLDVPDSVQKLLHCRLEAVDKQTRTMLDAASVAGQNIDLGLLSQTLQVEAKTLVAHIDRAVVAGLIIKDSTTRYRFSHDLICEFTYENLSSTTRLDYHNRIADILLNRGDIEANIEKAAFHLHEALPLSDVEMTFTTCQNAAELSARVYAHGDAAIYYRWALEALSLGIAIDPRVRAETLVSLGKQERLSGDAERARKSINEALQMARTYHFFDIVCDIATIGRATFLSAYIPRPTILDALKDALEQVPTDDKELRIQLFGQLALTPPFSTDIKLCKETSQKAVQLAKELDDRHLMRSALNATLCSLTGPDDINALLRSTKQIFKLQKQGEWTEAGIEAILARILAYIHQGDMTEAKKSIEVYGELMTRIHRVEGQWFYQRLLAQHQLDEGRFDDATRQFAELTKRAKRHGIYYFEIFHRIQTGYLMRAQGATIEYVRDLWKHTLQRFRTVSARAEIIGLIVEMGFADLVRDAYSEIISQGLDSVPRNNTWLNTLSNLALAAIAFDDQQRIRELYDLLSPYAKFNTPNGIFLYDGSVAHYLGVLASRLENSTRVIQHFEQAIEANQKMGLRPQLLRTQIVFAEFLRESDAPKYRKRLKALQKQAHENAYEMKMKPYLHRIALMNH